jgi:hypothetical protein
MVRQNDQGYEISGLAVARSGAGETAFSGGAEHSIFVIAAWLLSRSVKK